MNGVGVLFVGALGNVAATAMAGVAALRERSVPRRGMVTDLPEFAALDLIPPEELVPGGWDIQEGTPLDAVRRFAAANPAFPIPLFDPVAETLDAWGKNIFPGTVSNCGAAIEALAPPAPSSRVRCGSLERLVAGLQEDIRAFRLHHRLRTVVVVNLASTEPPLPPGPAHRSPEEMEALLHDDRWQAVRAGTLYAWAAVTEGCPFINFTPADAPLLPAVIRLAERRGIPIMGNDGKTGESLIKSALAPVFAARNLQVLSWAGFNLLGNGDGRILGHAENRAGKVRSKDEIVGNILGYRPHSRVGIDFVPSLEDQKIAWDFIHFEGFLGARMSLQFFWQGYDSLLAAPLVLDLVRLAELAARRGEGGLMPHLASFFKAPLGVAQHDFARQFRLLQEYAVRAAAEAEPLAR